MRRKNFSDLSELVGLLCIAVAVGFLANLWWGVLAGGVELVALSLATDSPEAEG